MPHLYSFNCWWTSWLLSCPIYCKQCCYEHWDTCVFFNYGFLRVYWAILLLVIYPQNHYLKDICTSIFTVTVFIVAKTRKKHKSFRPLMGKQIKKMWYIYTMEYYPIKKKKQNKTKQNKNPKTLPFAMMWLDFKYIMLRYISQRKTNTI